MYKVCIVEDEPANTAQIEEYLLRYGKENDVGFSIKKFGNGLDFLDAYYPDYDIIFMDIRMPEIDGMETARRLRKIDDKVHIIFVTNMLKYAVHGYEVRAFDFIVKPIDYFDFSARMRKFIEHSSVSGKREILLSSGDTIRRVYVEDIQYAEVVGHNVCYHFTGGKISVRESLVKAEKRLPERYFVRCNNGILVNLNYVQALEKDLVKVGGEWLPVSRAKKKEFAAEVTDFLANACR